MTQDVQPLTWQKRTNLEEHQQFFSKINEIIDNLAPTVDEAEAAIAQATAAIASANDAIATANAASAAASAAATQAQTAASTVAGYDTRLTAAEDSIDTHGQQITVLQGRTGALETGMSALGTRMTAAETKNSQQDTAIGALQTADAQNVKISRINEYAVGLTGNQDNIAGEKIFANQYRGMRGFILKSNADQFFKMGEFDGNVGGNGSLVFIAATRGTFGMFRVNIFIDSSTHTVTVGTDASNQIMTVTGTIKIGIDYDATNNVYRILYAAVTNNVSIHLDIMHATIGTGNNLNIVLKPIENVTPDASAAVVTV